MTDNQLFIDTLQDIREKIASGSKYHSIRACGLLRQLLVDGSNLLARVNRPYGLKIKFVVGHLGFKETGFTTDNMVVFWKPFLPNLSSRNSHEVTKDQFLAIKVIKTENHLFSVFDVIDVTSNISGGVHIGDPKNDKQIKYEELLKSIENPIISRDITQRTINDICLIVLDTLKPLEELITRTHPC
jgi:hypothetical protein